MKGMMEEVKKDGPSLCLQECGKVYVTGCGWKGVRIVKCKTGIIKYVLVSVHDPVNVETTKEN